MSEWQDISTAPKDGTGVRLRKGGEVFYGWFTNDPMYPWAFIENHEPWIAQRENCPDLIQFNAYIAEFGPTHWKPLK